MDNIHAYPLPGFREPVNCFSHLAAIPVFLVLGYLLVRRGRGSWVRTASLSAMAISSVFLLSMSSVYHILGNGPSRQIMKQLDVAGVFALIAGTATPVHAILFRGVNRWLPIVIAWSAAVVGVTLRVIYWGRLPPGIGTGIFVLLGWGGMFSCVLLWKRYGFQFVKPFLWGGLAYTIGAGLLLVNWPILIPGVIGAHELWHVAVLLGLSLHYEYVFQFAAGPPEALIRSSAAQDEVSSKF